MTQPYYLLTLQKTYFEKGFFNLGVDIERWITDQDTEVDLLLGPSTYSIKGRVTRSANLNGTPRVFGGVALADWFQKNFNMMDVVIVVVLGPTRLRLLPEGAT